MLVAVYGAGYVGLVSGVCFAKLGHQVTLVDVNKSRIAMLQEGISPIYETGLEDLLQEVLASGLLSFSSNMAELSQDISVHIIATGTPSLPDGSADLSQVYSVVHSLIEHVKGEALVVIKSTVPVGTGNAIAALINEKLHLASNPEFLREGSAVQDFLNADRIVVGGEAPAIAILRELYQPLIEKGLPFLSMSRQSAELAKYSANALLACKISFINQISQLAEKLEANIDDIHRAITLDPRIGNQFLNPGIGYGGSCFPKDVRALVQIAEAVGIDPGFLGSIDRINDSQKNWVFSQIKKHFKNALVGLRIGFWGLAFKPGTDDLREASSLVAIDALLGSGVKIIAYDPEANEQASARYAENSDIQFLESAEAVLIEKLDALVIATEWQEFKDFSLLELRDALSQAPLFDGRNCFSLESIERAGLAYYYSVGRPHFSS